jgi:capsid protein
MTRALNRAKDGKDLTEAGIIGAQVEQCFAGFIKTKASPVAAAIGAATSTDNGRRLQDVRPGSINYLGKDDEIVFSAPNKANSVGTLQEYNNRTIAAALNWPYEMLMKDWRGVSFAGGRIVLNAAKMSTKVRQKLIAESMLRPFWHRLVEESVIVGAVDIDARMYRDNRHAFNRHVWAGPRWSYAINPAEEVRATGLALDYNLTTLAKELSENQEDLEEVIAQRIIEREMERQGNIRPNAVAESEAATVTAEQTAQQLEQVAA